MGLPGGKRRKETLHSKVSESAAHVAGFGLHLEGFGPPNLPKGFFDNLKRRRNVPPALGMCVFSAIGLYGLCPRGTGFVQVYFQKTNPAGEAVTGWKGIWMKWNVL